MWITMADEEVKAALIAALAKDIKKDADLIRVSRVTRHQGGSVSASMWVEDDADGSA